MRRSRDAWWLVVVVIVAALATRWAAAPRGPKPFDGCTSVVDGGVAIPDGATFELKVQGLGYLVFASMSSPTKYNPVDYVSSAVMRLDKDRILLRADGWYLMPPFSRLTEGARILPSGLIVSERGKVGFNDSVCISKRVGSYNFVTPGTEGTGTLKIRIVSEPVR